MTDIILYSAPGTCGRVSTIVLEEAGLAFETRVIRFLKGEHKSPAFKEKNPKGKVPALEIDGAVLTENVAIIRYLAARFPEKTLLPKTSTLAEDAEITADLCFCSATLHPLVTRIRMPQFFAGPENAQAVWKAGCDAMREYFQLVEQRLANRPWWYGETWSAMDAYLYWVFWRVEGAEFPVKEYPCFCDHAGRMEERPSVLRAVAREDEMTAQLEAEGLVFTPPGVSAKP
ncbi:glutathione S-transferase family protein [Hyphococcus sp.]|uniref:glutathione S-transferase family protein n=1 Tax=Hyphococcus sp. TaxID=2038636 RepID=UPI003D0FF192